MTIHPANFGGGGWSLQRGMTGKEFSDWSPLLAAPITLVKRQKEPAIAEFNRSGWKIGAEEEREDLH